MKKTLFFLTIITLLLLAGCVSKNKYDAQEGKLSAAEQKIESLKVEINQKNTEINNKDNEIALKEYEIRLKDAYTKYLDLELGYIMKYAFLKDLFQEAYFENWNECTYPGISKSISFDPVNRFNNEREEMSSLIDDFNEQVDIIITIIQEGEQLEGNYELPLDKQALRSHQEWKKEVQRKLYLEPEKMFTN